MASQGLAGGRGEIEAAKRSLATAKKWEASTAESLKTARERLKDAQRQVNLAQNEADNAREQVKEAHEYLLSAEKKWEVIDVDDDEESASGARVVTRIAPDKAAIEEIKKARKEFYARKRSSK